MAKIRLRNPFASHEDESGDEEKRREEQSNENDIGHDIRRGNEKVLEAPKEEEKQVGKGAKKSKKEEPAIRSRSSLSLTAYGLLAGRLPTIPQYKEVYEQAGMPLVYEAYLSTGFLIAFMAIIPTFVVSYLLEIKIFPRERLIVPIAGSVVLSFVTFATVILLWLAYPILRRRGFKSDLENHLAYSFGILGVLAAAGMTLDRLFEKIASSESNAVLAELAKRFLRNVRVFGLDSETALQEVALHSPSQAFAGMLESIAVAYRTTGSIHDLVMFESSRLLQDKSDNLRRAISSLAVMAELYITLVVVGPIIFIVMLAIFGLLPTGGLPDPIFLINLIVFIGIPVLSVVFILLLDSVVTKSS
jgi:archaeal flagellar protein FlaJ